MKKIITLLAALLVVLVTVITPRPASAGPIELKWRKQVNAKKCDPVGKALIDVDERVINDADSGQAGNTWAFDAYSREIKVYLQSDGNYCAVVSYHGEFVTVPGQASPGSTTGHIFIMHDADHGHFDGGYRALITGTLRTSPGWPTKGSVGKIDYKCDINANCPGLVIWTDQYFNPGYVFNYAWWGWIYHARAHDTWVNSIDGNQGDIQ